MGLLILGEGFRNTFRALISLKLLLAFSFGAVSGIEAGGGRSLATEATLLLPIAFELCDGERAERDLSLVSTEYL